ncbi:MAG: hypothetical protein QNJ15_05625 [Erythrobacter sp.]|nr:hypothetical protein [Erythrobacter sp.]
MNVHPAIRALRGDWASQRRAQAALQQAVAAWYGSGLSRDIEKDLKHYGGGAELAGCASLLGVLTDHGAALDWVRGLIERLIPTMCEEPLGDLPLRFGCSEGFATIQLFSAGRAVLSMVAYDPPQRRSRPETVLLVDRESTELLLCGQAEGVSHHCEDPGNDRVDFATCTHCWREGDQIELTAGDARHLLRFDRTILTLQLMRSAEIPKVTRKFNLSDGRLLSSASGDKQASRDQMALNVLGAMPDCGAFETMERLALDTTRDLDLRWEAVRQSLALNSVRGFAVLSTLARRPKDPLALPAARLRSQLIAEHAGLAKLDREAA